MLLEKGCLFKRFWDQKKQNYLLQSNRNCYIIKNAYFFGCIAQLVERSVHTRYVESSILPTATICLLADPKGF